MQLFLPVPSNFPNEPDAPKFGWNEMQGVEPGVHADPAIAILIALLNVLIKKAS